MRLAVLCSAAALAAIVSASQACPLQALSQRLERADEHVFWYDFWLDLDPREAAAELGYARADYTALLADLDDADCRYSPAAATMWRNARRSLATCLRWEGQEVNLVGSLRTDR